MKKKHTLGILFGLAMCASITGCGNIEKTDVESVVTQELDQLKNLDADTAKKYISVENLFPDITENTSNPEVIETFVSNYFENFDYKILDIKTNKNDATASLRLNTIDAQSLARDFTTAHLKEQILIAANTGDSSQTTSSTTLDEHYTLLNQLISDHDYKTVENNCTISLKKSGDTWVIQKNDDLENEIVGGFISSIANPNLLTPSETLDIHLSTIKEMDALQLTNYLGISNLLNTDNDTADQIANALLNQANACYSYEIGESSIDGAKATVNVKITTFNSDTIVKNYNDQLAEYLKTPQALYDGEEGRATKSMTMLLSSITDNKETTTLDVPVVLQNNGAGWVLRDSNVIGNAVFGTLTDTLKDSTTSDVSTTSTESEDTEDSESSDENEDSSYDSEESNDSDSSYDSSEDSDSDSSYDSDSDSSE